MFSNLEQTSKTLIFISVLISLVFGIFGAILIPGGIENDINFTAIVGGKIPFFCGLLLGACFTVLKIILIDRSCKKVLDMEVNAGKLYGMGQYFFRFLLTAAVLVLAMLAPQLSFLGCTLGVLSLQIAGYIAPIIEKRKKAQL